MLSITLVPTAETSVIGQQKTTELHGVAFCLRSSTGRQYHNERAIIHLFWSSEISLNSIGHGLLQCLEQSTMPIRSQFEGGLACKDAIENRCDVAWSSHERLREQRRKAASCCRKRGVHSNLAGQPHTPVHASCRSGAGEHLNCLAAKLRIPHSQQSFLLKASGSLAVEERYSWGAPVLPGLKPYHPNHKMKVPRACISGTNA